MALLYARFYFSGKNAPPAVHAVGLASLSFLSCVKTSGLAFAGIVGIFICLHRFVALFRAGRTPSRFRTAFKGASALALKLGGAALLSTAALGCAPYVTDLLEGRHMFHSVYESYRGDEGDAWTTAEDLKGIAERLYPGLNNRFTRFFVSVAAYPTWEQKYPVELKDPLTAPRLEWDLYRHVGNAQAGGLGPFFYLLCLLALLYAALGVLDSPRGSPDAWLLLTLLAMTAIHPHSWQVRYVPFVWVLPAVLFQFLPAKRDFLLLVPLALFAADAAGVSYVFASDYLGSTRRIERELTPYRGQAVLLDRSCFQVGGFFDRFGIRQKFANPEAEKEDFSNEFWAAPRLGRETGRMSFGSNLAFEEDLPPLPAVPLVLADGKAVPWRRMSDGLALLTPESMDVFYTRMAKAAEVLDLAESGKGLPPGEADSVLFSLSEMRQIAPTLPPTRESAEGLERGVWNYDKKVKLYMRVADEPKGDLILALTASPRRVDGASLAQETEVFVNNRSLGTRLWEGPGEKTLVIPLELLKESFEGEMRLLTLMFLVTLPGEPEFGLKHSLNFEKLEFRK
jgi:hypothetical protein